MKNNAVITGFALLLAVCVILMILPWALGMTMDALMWIMTVILLCGVVALAACIALQARSSVQKKIPELKPKMPLAQTQKAEENLPAKEAIEEKPTQTQIEEKQTQPTVKEKSDRVSKIIDIEGIGSAYAEKLNTVNIFTTSDLLAAGGTPHGRKEIAEKTGISGDLILRWVNISDLFRIKGVGEEYSDLLEAGGVDTVVELAKRVPENLLAKMLEVNEQKNLVRRLPTLNEVTQWIEEAKKLKRKVEY